MELVEAREKMDEIDRKIVALYEERMALSGQIAAIKIEKGMKVLDRSQEARKIEKVRSMIHDSDDADGIEELYKLIMSISRKKQHAILREHGIPSEEETGDSE